MIISPKPGQRVRWLGSDGHHFLNGGEYVVVSADGGSMDLVDRHGKLTDGWVAVNTRFKIVEDLTLTQAITTLKALRANVYDEERNDDTIEAVALADAVLSKVEGRCPPEYVGPGGFYIYDFMPQRIHFKTSAGDMTALQVRGWGHLIGQGGGLGLPEDTAAKTQDDFARWVVNTLNAALLTESQR